MRLCQAGTSVFCSLLPITIILDLDLVSTLLRFFQGDVVSSSNLSEEKVCEKHENPLNGDEDTLRGNTLGPNVSVSERQCSGVDETSMDISVEELHIVLDYHNQTSKSVVCFGDLEGTGLQIKYKQNNEKLSFKFCSNYFGLKDYTAPGKAYS